MGGKRTQKAIGNARKQKFIKKKHTAVTFD